jgi:hypothetical protein
LGYLTTLTKATEQEDSIHATRLVNGQDIRPLQ